MPTFPPPAIWVRSYGPDSGTDRHDFVQFVLPLAGSLEMDIAGRQERLDRRFAAYVEDGAPHAQSGRGANRALILDLDPSLLAGYAIDGLRRRPFLRLSPAASHLVDYMGHALAGGPVTASRLRLWTPLLLDALVGAPARPRSRLGALLAAVEADPGAPWTAASMARTAGLSVSRLHALFRSELDTSPRAWLAALRLERVREGLEGSSLAIAELAYREGYADQSALTRAMRKATGMTPAAYRRRAQESATRKSET